MKIAILAAAVILAFVLLREPARSADGPSPFARFEALMGGEIPFPPELIVRKLVESGIEVTAAIVPHGRSLERRVTSELEPRSLFAFKLRDGARALPFFVAYTPRNRQLQILGTSAVGDRFEPLRIFEYGLGLRPRKAPSVGLCISCHQENGLVFPDTPWSETVRSKADRRKFSQKPGLDPFARWLLQVKHPLVSVNSDGFDGLVRNASAALHRRRACVHACGKSAECLRNLMIATLGNYSTNGSDFPDAYGEKWREFAARTGRLIREYGDTRVFWRPSDVLPDRDPAPDPLEFTRKQDPLEPRPLVTFIGAKLDPEVDLEVGLAAMLSAQECLPPGGEVLRRGLNHGKLRGLESSEALLNTVRQSWPLSFGELKAALSGVPLNSGALLSSETILGFDATLSPDLRPRSPAVLFQNYCATCHLAFPHHPSHGGVDPIVPPLPLDNLNELANYRGAGDRTVQRLLRKHLMPPPDFFPPTEQEREIMLRALGTAQATDP